MEQQRRGAVGERCDVGSAAIEPLQSAALEEIRTVDVGPRRQRRILRQRLGYVIVGSVDIVVFLGRGAQVSIDSAFGGRPWLRTLVSTL